jgi:hypothetical protein
MNAMRVPLEAHKERSGVCFGGFRPSKHVEEPRAFARGAPLPYLAVSLLQVFLPYFLDRWVLTFLNFIWPSNLLSAN